MSGTNLSIFELLELFPDDSSAEAWFTENRWPNGVACIECGSLNVQARPTRTPQPYRCRDCRRDFSVKTETLMHGSQLGLRVWAVAIYLLATNPKGVSSLALHRHLGITQKTAWFLAHRIRETWEDHRETFAGPVEVDETHIGGRVKNMHGDERRAARAKFNYGKSIVAGARDRPSGHVAAEVIESASRSNIVGFLEEHAAEEATIYHDEASVYQRLPWEHEGVNHSIGEYVRDGASTNGIESFWALLKRAHMGIFHKMSPKHLHRYVRELAGRNNHRGEPALEHMAAMAASMNGKRLMYRDLIADNGLSSGARS